MNIEHNMLMIAETHNILRKLNPFPFKNSNIIWILNVLTASLQS